jgi:transcription elongation GreA/GreB family factor
VLNTRGWKLHRIWSTDWFSNASGERERLRNVIEQHVRELLQNRAEKLEAQSADEIEAVDEPTLMSQPAAIDTMSPQNDLFGEEFSLDPTAPTSDSATDRTVETPSVRTVGVGDKVRLRKLDETGAEMMVTLSTDQHSPEEGLISTNTPLGEAILDAEEGEEIEYQVGSYIRKVEVVSLVTD